MASELSEGGQSDINPNNGQSQLQHTHGGTPGYLPAAPEQSPIALPSEAQMAPSYGLQSSQPVQSQLGIAEQFGATSTILAVTNLPYRIRWQDLKDLFRRYGTPSRADVFLAPDGRSRGVGMVSMRTRREAENCVNDLNGYEWFGRKIGVRIDETGGHHALAAAAMAGATIWEGVSFSHSDYEVLSRNPFTFIFCFYIFFFLFVTCD